MILKDSLDFVFKKAVKMHKFYVAKDEGEYAEYWKSRVQAYLDIYSLSNLTPPKGE